MARQPTVGALPPVVALPTVAALLTAAPLAGALATVAGPPGTRRAGCRPASRRPSSSGPLRPAILRPGSPQVTASPRAPTSPRTPASPAPISLLSRAGGDGVDHTLVKRLRGEVGARLAEQRRLDAAGGTPPTPGGA